MFGRFAPVLAIAVGSLLAGSPAVLAQEASSSQAAPAKNEPKVLKFYELKHRKPLEILKLLRLSKGDAGENRGALSMVGKKGTSLPGMSVKIAAIGPTLIARGSSDEVEFVGKVVEAFDRPEAELMKVREIGPWRIVPLASNIEPEEFEEIEEVMSHLDIPVTSIQVSQGLNFLLIRSSEEGIEQQAAEVLRRMQGADVTAAERA